MFELHCSSSPVSRRGHGDDFRWLEQMERYSSALELMVLVGSFLLRTVVILTSEAV